MEGIRGYGRYYEIGFEEVFLIQIDLNPNNRNEYIQMNLLHSGQGRNPIGCSLVYTNKSSMANVDFGKNVKSSEYRRISQYVAGRRLVVERGDGSEEAYRYDTVSGKYKNNEQQMTAVTETEEESGRVSITFLDEGDTKWGLVKGNHYPGYIEKGVKRTNYGIASGYSLVSVDNGLDDEIEYIHSNEKVTEIRWKKKGIEIYRVNLTYTDHSLSQIVFFRVQSESEIVELKRYRLLLNEQTMRIESLINGESVRKVQIVKNGNRTTIEKTEGTVTLSDSIVYSENKTVLTEDGEKETVYIYDANDRIVNIVDASKRVIYTKYDGYKPIKIGKPMNILEATSLSLAVNGFLSEGLANWTTDSGTVLIRSSIDGDPVLKLTAGGSVSQTIPCTGTSLDSFTLIGLFANLGSGTKRMEGRITAFFYQDHTLVDSFACWVGEDFYGNSYRYEISSHQMRSSFDSIKIQIQSSNEDTCFGGIQLVKTDAVSTISYTSEDELLKVTTRDQDSRFRREKGKWVSGNIGNRYFEKKEEGNTEVLYSDFGVSTQITKDEYEREVSRLISNGSERWASKTTYSGDEMTAESDGILTTKYGYDTRERDLRTVTNPEGRSTTYTYNSKRLLHKIAQGGNQNIFTYTEDDKLDTYNLYENTYANGRLSEIKLNGHLLTSFGYDQKGRIQTISASGETTTCQYTGDQLTEIVKNGQSTTYVYDPNDRLKSVTCDNRTITYEYDENDCLIAETNRSHLCRTFYQEGTSEKVATLNSLNREHLSRNIDTANRRIGKSYTSFKEAMYRLPRGTEQSPYYRNFCCFFDKEDLLLVNKKIYADRYEEERSVSPIVALPKTRYQERNSVQTSTDLLVYPIGEYIGDDETFSMSLLFDVYLSSSTPKDSILCYIGSSEAVNGSLFLKYQYSESDNCSYFSLFNILDGKEELVVGNTGNGVYLKAEMGWNHIGISFQQYSQGRTCEKYFVLEVDDRTVEQRYTGASKKLVGMNSRTVIAFGGKYQSGVSSSLSNVYLSDVMINLCDAGDHFTKEELVQLYELKERYQAYEYPLEGGDKTRFGTGAAYMKLSDVDLYGSEIYPLNGTFSSLKGKKPYRFDPVEEVSYDVGNYFSFDRKNKRYEYECIGHRLVYKEIMNQSGTISVATFVENNPYVKCLFALQLGENILHLIVQGTFIKCIRGSIDTGTTLCTGSIDAKDQRVTLTWTYTGNQFTFRVYSDITLIGSFSIAVTAVPSDVLISLGADFERRYPYGGKVYRLVTRRSYVGGGISAFIESIREIRKTREYDEFGRVKIERAVNSRGTEAYKKTHTYKSYMGNGSTFLSADVIARGGNTDRFTYRYETGTGSSFKNISLLSGINYVSGSTNKATQYTYDANGRLTVEVTNGIVTTYSYDSRGNLLTKGKTAFTYSSSYPDRLETVGEHAVIYDSAYPYRMLSYGSASDGLTFTYSGKQIASMTNKATNETIVFQYDGFGRRISKANKNYVYLDGKLDAEYTGDYTLRFLYDEQEELFGFYYNDTPYFYLKNAMGIIYAVIDDTGKKVVEYSYDAWGRILTMNRIDETIADLNPFVYKSYYYDRETSLFWLSSRYYSPELCRFISPDSIEYLNPESLNGLNLFCYCYNNPVMYADPSGHFAITLTALLIGIGIGAGIGASIGLGSAIFSDYREDGIWFNGDWTDYLGKSLGGAIAGAGIGLAGTLGAGLGVAMLAEESLTILGSTISGSAALTISGLGAFSTGMAGYAVRTGISRFEDFELSHMFIEGTTNMASGLISFVGGFCGGALQLKIPGAQFNLKNFLLFQAGSAYFGVLPMKIIISYIKKILEDRY